MTSYDLSHRHRRSIRLKGYDYTQPGAYFISICTKDHENLFGDVLNGEMRLNDAGLLAKQCWCDIPTHFHHIELDAFVIMPNHIHGVLWIVDNVGATHASPLPGPPRGPIPQSIGAIVGQFKSAVTKHINILHKTPGAKVWQRNYYEHIIRDQRALNAIRQYIIQNPLRWHLDCHNPHRIGNNQFQQKIKKIIKKTGVSKLSSRKENAL